MPQLDRLTMVQLVNKLKNDVEGAKVEIGTLATRYPNDDALQSASQFVSEDKIEEALVVLENSHLYENKP